MKTIQHSLWETAKKANDKVLAQHCRIEFALAGWDHVPQFSEFIESGDADICLCLDEWEGIDDDLGEWSFDELKRYFKRLEKAS